MPLDNILPFAHRTLAAHIRPGDTVVDATAGNGHDALWLAQCVGVSGCVYAFDVCAAALAATRTRLQAAGLGGCLHTLEIGHEHMAESVPAGVAAVVFNCGWRPGGDKTRTTQAATTVAAMRQALALLRSGGVLVAVLYPGHAAGAHEARVVGTWAAALPQQHFSVLQYGFTNRAHCPPYLLAIEKAA